MKKIFFYSLTVLMLANSCSEKEYTAGDLTPPTNLQIITEIVGQDGTHPNGDGSGDVKITLKADNALSYKVDYDANNAVDLVYLPTGSITKKYTTLGTNTYRLTAVAYGKGGTSTTVTKEITVRSDFTPDASIVSNLTGGTSKTWIVDKTVPGHMGVGPWNVGSIRPEWWAAAVNEKVACCPCFYTTTYRFIKDATAGTYSLQVTNPDGAFTKTGSLASIPGIPSSGAEGCYPYGGGTSSFTFVPSSSGAPATPSVPANSPSTQTSILLGGTNTYIAYGSCQKEFEILAITPTYLYLRAQGTETGNAWYFKLIPQ
ncbi:MAG: hypothetical protein WAT19_08480 [Ferruginibacter sp.]